MKKTSCAFRFHPAGLLIVILLHLQIVFLSQNAWAAPGNDNFASATAFAGAGGALNGTNVDATAETNEPTHYFSGPLDSGYFQNSGNSVWYRWTAPSTGNASVQYSATFGPVIAVYTGTSFANLSQISATYVAGSKISWRAAAGTTYYVALDSLFYFVNGQALDVDNGPFSLTLNFAPSPANDNFANAITVTGNANQTTGNNAGAYVEENEPYHAARDSSMWYRWTAAANGSVIFDTEGSAFDTVLTAYTGSAIGGLTQVAQDNDGGTDNLSKLPFTVAAGTTYTIAVGGNGAGFGSPRGNFTLKWAFTNAPANDNFAGQTALTPAAGGKVLGTNVGASIETGEPDPAYGPTRQSIWYNWTAPSNGVVTIDTTGSACNTYLVAYTGTQVNGLTSVAFNDNDERSAPLNHSKVKFTATSGTIYRVRVDNAAYESSSEASIGYANTHGATTLNWKFAAAPANDLFASATNLAAVNGGSIVGSNVGGSLETGENDPTYSYGTASIWYKWKAPSNGVVTMDTNSSKTTLGADFNTHLAVYTGTQVKGLTSVAANNDDERSNPLTFSKVKFTAVAGTTYFVRLDNGGYASGSDSSLVYDQAHGALTLTWSFVAAPGNDNFANAQALTEGKVQSSNVGASLETGENDPTYSYGTASLWYKWTAPATGVATLDTKGSKTSTGLDYNTHLAVYTGTQVNALTSVAANNDDEGSAPLTHSKVKFTAVGGTTYFVRVDNGGYASNSDSSLFYDQTHGTLFLTTSFSAAPANDAYANAANLVPAEAGRVQGSNVGASLETGENDPTYSYGTASLWYKWTAPSGGDVTFSTVGSKTTTGIDYNTHLAVYTGGVLSALTQVAANNDDGALVTSKLTFTAQGGTTYFVRVDNGGYTSGSDSALLYDASHGDISLSWTLNGAPVQAPTITSFTPSSGKAATVVTLTGSGFTGATSVAFNGVNGAVTSVSNTQIVVKAPTGVTTGRITVTTPKGTAVNATNFLVLPTITSFTPSVGNAGLDVTITGTAFTGVTSVQFAGLEAAFTVNSATQIVAKVPAGAITGKITITTAGGTVLSGAEFLVPARIDSFTPTTGPVGTRVTITGANFLKTTAVTFNGVKAATPTITATTLSVLVPAGATTGPIAVTTAAGTTTSAATFTVIQAPTITSFTPATGAVGTSVTINGTNFISGGTTVKFGGVVATSVTYSSASKITAVVPVGAITGKITLTTVAGTVASATDFVVTTPIVTSFTPIKGNVGTVVTITGNNFTAASAVKFGTLAGTNFTFVSATQIKATVPANALTGKVSVTMAAKTTASTTDFIVAPRLTAFTPNKGAVSTVVTITGANFIVGGTTVKLGALAGANVTVTSTSKMTFAVPAGAATGKVAVTTTAGTATSTADFLVAPSITSFTPTSGKVGTTITINGKNFVSGATTVLFGTGTATSVTFVSASKITAVVPANAVTGKISVTTVGGTATSATDFLVLPTVTSFTPTSGKPGTVVTIDGTSFVKNATTIEFGTVTATTVTFVSSSRVTAIVPANAVTGRIAATTAGGTGTSTPSFTVLPANAPADSAPSTNLAAISSAPASKLALSSATADAATDSFTLNFLGLLDVETALQAASYQVKINGLETGVQLVSVSVTGNSITLGLGEGAVASGDIIEVEYQLLDTKKRVLPGTSSASAR